MKLLYFAWVRDMTGISREDIPLPDGVSTVGQLIDWLKQRDDKMARAFADTAMIRAAVNQQYVGTDHRLGEGDEVAFFPPVTGG